MAERKREVAKKRKDEVAVAAVVVGEGAEQIGEGGEKGGGG